MLTMSLAESGNTNFNLPPGTPPLPPAYAGESPPLTPEVHTIPVQPWQVAVEGVRARLQYFSHSRAERRERRKERKAEKIQDKIDVIEQRQSFRDDMHRRVIGIRESDDPGSRAVEPVTRRQQRAEKKVAKMSEALWQKRKTLGGRHHELHNGPEYMEYHGVGIDGVPYTRKLAIGGKKAPLKTFRKKRADRKETNQSYARGEIDAFEVRQRKFHRTSLEVRTPPHVAASKAREIRRQENRIYNEAYQPYRHKKDERKLRRKRRKITKIETSLSSGRTA